MDKELLSKAGGLAGAAGVFFGAMTSLPTGLIGDLLISTPLSAVTGFMIWRFWPGKRPVTSDDIKAIYKSLDEIATNGSTIDHKLVVESIQTGTTKLDRILLEAEKIKAPNTKRRIQHIVTIGRKIVEDFRVDPKDVYLAQSWLNSYLDETIALVRNYAELSTKGARNLEAQKQMAKFDGMIDILIENYQKLLDKLLANDVTDFDINMTVMENRLKNEGI